MHAVYVLDRSVHVCNVQNMQMLAWLVHVCSVHNMPGLFLRIFMDSTYFPSWRELTTGGEGGVMSKFWLTFMDSTLSHFMDSTLSILWTPQFCQICTNSLQKQQKHLSKHKQFASWTPQKCWSPHLK